MEKIVRQILAKDKASAIIQSCENCTHYDVAEQYIKNYKKLFGDMVGTTELLRNLQGVKLKNLNNG